MALGQAAGTAAHLSLIANVPVRDVPIKCLQRQLLAQGQVLTFFKDIDRAHSCFAGLQFCGCLGFFEDYYARADESLDGPTALRWFARAGLLDLSEVEWRDAATVTWAQLAAVVPEWMGGDGVPTDRLVSRGAFCQALFEAQARDEERVSTEVVL